MVQQNPLLVRRSSESSWLPHCLMPFVCCLVFGRAKQGPCAVAVGAACSSVLLEALAPALERSESSHQSVL